MAGGTSNPAKGAPVAGLEDLQEKERARWAKAERSARGVADNGMGEAVRLYYTRYFPVGLLILVALVLVISTALPGPVEWSRVLTFGVLACGFSAGIGGFVFHARYLSRRVDLGDGLGVLFPLEQGEQKRVMQEIAGKAPPTPEHLVVARAAAVHARKQEAGQLLIAPMWMCMFGTVGGSAVVYVIPLLLLMIAVPVIAGISFRRKGRFLARTEDMVPVVGK